MTADAELDALAKRDGEAGRQKRKRGKESNARTASANGAGLLLLP